MGNNKQKLSLVLYSFPLNEPEHRRHWPHARRVAAGKPRLASQRRDALSGKRRAKAEKRRIGESPGTLSFGSFSLGEQRK